MRYKFDVDFLIVIFLGGGGGVSTTNFYPIMKYNLFQERFEYQLSQGIDFIQTNNDKEYLPLTSSKA